jgi:hypothetical protein
LSTSARAREIRWRWPPEKDDRKELQRLLSALGTVADAVNPQTLLDDSRHRHPGVERGVRILEHDLEAAPHAAHLCAVERKDVRAVEVHAPALRLLEADDAPAERRLAASRLADQAERLAAPDVERVAVDGANDLATAATTADHELLDELLDAEQRVVGVGTEPWEPRAAVLGRERRRRHVSLAAARARCSFAK